MSVDIDHFVLLQHAFLKTVGWRRSRTATGLVAAQVGPRHLNFESKANMNTECEGKN